MKIFKIVENDANQRLDKFLKKLFPRATRSLIYKFNRKGKIKVKEIFNDKFQKKDNEYKLKVGDEIKIFLSDKDFEELQKKEEKINLNSNEKFDKKDIVYEDKFLLVINKNPGINVHPGDHKTKETNVISQIQDYLSEKLNSLTFKPSLIHRIDRDTSGILMIGKTKNILVKLVNDFKNHKKIKKTYYTIVLGKLPKNTGIINKKLLRIQNAKNENKVQVSEKGQIAITHYKKIKEHILETENEKLIFTEVEIEIKTGRMHQIRVHMAFLGNPILGDKIYGDKKINSFLKRNFNLTRQALHAYRIEFFHYERNKILKLEARIKNDLKIFLDKIKK